MNTGLRTPGIASPLQKRYLARSNKDSIVFRLRLTCIMAPHAGSIMVWHDMKIDSAVFMRQVMVRPLDVVILLLGWFAIHKYAYVARSLVRNICYILKSVFLSRGINQLDTCCSMLHYALFIWDVKWYELSRPTAYRQPYRGPLAVRAAQ